MELFRKTSFKEKRQYERYDTEAKVYFRVAYDIKTNVEFQVVQKNDNDKTFSQKYPGVSKNVSIEGLCFSSNKKLQKGDFIHLEVYLPAKKEPIHMEGQVRWSHPTSLKQKLTRKFDTGVKLLSVENKSVLGSIYYDEANKVTWSVVLDSVFGNFSKFSHKKAL